MGCGPQQELDSTVGQQKSLRSWDNEQHSSTGAVDLPLL
jgi:hypothetical protein